MLRLIRHLPYFVVVAEELSFQRASKRLNIAQSALSRRIRELELDLEDTQLFERKGPVIELTRSGSFLLKAAKRSLLQLDEAQEIAIALGKGLIGDLRLGYTIAALRHPFLTALVRGSIDSISDVGRLELTAAPLPAHQLVEHLRAGQCHAGILFGTMFESDLDSLVIASEPYRLAVSKAHSLAKKSTVTFTDVCHEEFVWHARSLEPDVHDFFLEQFARAGGKPPRITYESPSIDTSLRWVATGNGLTFVPASLEQEVLDVELLEVEEFDLKLEFSLVWKSDSNSKHQRRLIDAVKMALSIGAEEQEEG